jgi:hypothetical protein
VPNICVEELVELDELDVGLLLATVVVGADELGRLLPQAEATSAKALTKATAMNFPVLCFTCSPSERCLRPDVSGT